MKKFFSSIVLVIVLALPSFALSVPSTHLVSADWLSKNANSVVIVDLSSPKGYAKGHIPGAVNIPKKMFFQGYMGSIKHLLDTPAQVQKLFRNAGISNNSVVIFTSHVKKAKKFADMTRGLWTAWIYGLRNVAILDGGIEAWKGSLSSKAPTVAKGNFTPAKLSVTDIKTWGDVYSAIASKDIQFADAREMKHYVGKDKDKRLKKHGHILGAKKVSAYLFSKKDGKIFKLVTPSQAKDMINKAGISLNKPIITYCNTGHLATGTWFVAKFLAGVKQIGVYDASMYEYTRTSMPIAQGK